VGLGVVDQSGPLAGLEGFAEDLFDVFVVDRFTDFLAFVVPFAGTASGGEDKNGDERGCPKHRGSLVMV
jgi:hypothetical protein